MTKVALDRHIVALGGGGFSMEPGNPLLDSFVLSLTRKSRPRIGFLPTASGDSNDYVALFYRTFSAERYIPSHLPVFHGSFPDPSTWLNAQDVIYVGGGNTASMLAVWRVHGIDRALRQAWRAGIVLCGVSAGAMCWFNGGLTDSFGAGARPLHDGLGLLKGLFCPHYNNAERRKGLSDYVMRGELSSTYAVEDGCALHFTGSRLTEAISSRPQARAFRVQRQSERLIESPLKVRFLGSAP